MYLLYILGEINLKKKIFVRLSIKDRLISFQLDSGATVNILPELLAREALGRKFKLRTADAALSLYDKSVLETVGMITAVVINPKRDEEFEVDFYVTKKSHVTILGAETCQTMNLLTVNYENVLSLEKKDSNRTEPLSLKEVNETFSDLFTGYGKLEGQLHLKTDPSVEPVRMLLRRIPIAIKEKVRAELDVLVKNKIIEPMIEPSSWISALLVVEKNNGDIRICIDPKPLNKALLRNHYPMTTIDDILPDLNNAKVFSTCDTRHGFCKGK